MDTLEVAHAGAICLANLIQKNGCHAVCFLENLPGGVVKRPLNYPG